MSTIMFGRREGQQQQTMNVMTQLPIGFMTQGINPKDVAVFQPKDWNRIQNSLTRYNHQAAKQESSKRDREKLHATSKELVKHWENTIEGQRLKKLQAHQIREEQEEIEKQKIDLEEAKLQAEKRKEAIQRAKQLQYYETDRVKGFHGALLLTEVLKEREAQIEMKKNIKNLQKEREAFNLAMTLKNHENELIADMEREKSRFNQACAVRKFQKLQIKDKEGQATLEKEEDFEEGENIKQQVKAYNIAKHKIDQYNRHAKEALKKTYWNEMNLKKEREEEQKIKEEEENKKIRKFVIAKRKMASMQKEKEQELFDTFQQHTSKMRDKLDLEMRQRVDDEDDRIAKAVAEQEKKRMEDENRKLQNEKEIIEQTKVHRLEQISNAVKQQEMNLKIDKQLLQRRIKEDHDFHEFALKEKSKKREDLSNLQTIHKLQMSRKDNDMKKKNREELDFDKKNTELLVKEEEMFQSYANNVIEDAKKGGRNPFPLIKAKNEGPGGGRGPKFEGKAGLRPSCIVSDATGVQLPHYLKDDQVYNRCYNHVGKSGKRIGFTW